MSKFCGGQFALHIFSASWPVPTSYGF